MGKEEGYYNRENFYKFKEDMTEEQFVDWNNKSIEINQDKCRENWLKTHIDVVCNNCGESLLVFSLSSERPEIYGVYNYKIIGGYSSPTLDDGTTYYFNLCEKCIKKMFDNFKISVLEGEYDLWDGHEIRLSEEEIKEKLGDIK